MNRFHVAPCIALAFMAMLAGCGKAGAPDAFPKATAEGWLGSFNGGDVAGLALMYSDDAEILPPDHAIVTGHDAIDTFWQSYNPGQVRIEVTDDEATKLGEIWYREGAYRAVYADEGEPRVGKFIELWKKQGGSWLLYRQMWSPNSPLPVLAQPDQQPDESS
jgi:ketosteroid isomerase-like protein